LHTYDSLDGARPAGILIAANAAVAAAAERRHRFSTAIGGGGRASGPTTNLVQAAEDEVRRARGAVAHTARTARRCSARRPNSMSVSRGVGRQAGERPMRQPRRARRTCGRHTPFDAAWDRRISAVPAPAPVDPIPPWCWSGSGTDTWTTYIFPSVSTHPLKPRSIAFRSIPSRVQRSGTRPRGTTSYWGIGFGRSPGPWRRLHFSSGRSDEVFKSEISSALEQVDGSSTR